MDTLSYRCGPATIALDDRGSVVSVIHAQYPMETWLVGGGVPEVVIAAQPLDWTFEGLVTDLDEVEIERSSWPLSTTVRHTFTERWGVQLTLNNLSSAPVLVDRASLSWRSDPRRPAWALAAGAAGSYALSQLDAVSRDPADSPGLILGGVLAGGICNRIDAEALRSGPITVAPGGLYVVRWNWDWYGSAAEFTAARHRDVPWTHYLQTGGSIRIESDADTAIVVTGDVLVEEERSVDDVLLEAWGEGCFTVELSSARGTTRYPVYVSETQPVVGTRAAHQALRGPLTAAGVVKLPDVHAALAVQQALLGGDIDRIVAEDALELFVARQLEDPQADPMMISLAATEAERTGEEEILQAAVGWWEAPTGFIPGLGLALSPLYLAALTRGSTLPQLPRWWGGGVTSVTDALSNPTAWAAELEHLMVGGPHPPGTDEMSRRLQAARAVGAWLGAGLKGEAVRPLPVADSAYLATALSLCGEHLFGPLEQSWAYGTANAVARTQAEVRWRIADLPAGAALSWLILADRVQ